MEMDHDDDRLCECRLVRRGRTFVFFFEMNAFVSVFIPGFGIERERRRE